MKVRIKINYTVCRDGIHPESFEANEEVDMPAHVASVLLNDGRAVLPKMRGGAPANKMLGGSPETK